MDAGIVHMQQLGFTLVDTQRNVRTFMVKKDIALGRKVVGREEKV